MTQSVADIARELSLNGREPFGGGSFNELHQKLAFFKSSHYDQYIPTLGSEFPDFEQRLYDWLMNLPDDEDRRILLELAPRIAFFTREDFTKLHQAAFRGPISQWIVDELDLPFSHPTLTEEINRELEDHTWFTAITDSMHISEFHHANRLGGIDHRPDWRSLSEFGDPARIRQYMNNRKDATGAPKPIHRIVILEDFVGSGSQMQAGHGSVEFAARNFADIPILLVPLITCPEGARLAKVLAGIHTKLTFSPVLEITQAELINPKSNFTTGSFEDAVRRTCVSVHSKVVGNGAAAPRPYSEWGFGQTGALIVLYSNTPANTLPIIQHESDTWGALFPRSARIR